MGKIGEVRGGGDLMIIPKKKEKLKKRGEGGVNQKKKRTEREKSGYRKTGKKVITLKGGLDRYPAFSRKWGVW